VSEGYSPPPPPPPPRSGAGLLIGLLATISVLLLVIIFILLRDDSGEESASTVSSTETTAPETTTTTEAADTTFLLLPTGLGDIAIGADPADLVAAGLMTYGGPDFTPELDGYLCGFGDSAGPYGPDAFAGQMMDRGLVRLYIIDDRIRTPEGIGVGSSEADMLAALGPPFDSYPDVYVETQTNHLYASGDYGLMFKVEGGEIIQANAGFYDALGFAEGCL
jgi:hypothetical protein